MLDRSDIVGKKIFDIIETPPEIVDGVEVCRGVVCLEMGVGFELQSQDPLLLLPIFAIDATDIPLGRRLDKLCGRRISEVVTSLYWPTLGVIVDEEWLVFMNSDAPSKFTVTVARIGETYGAADYRPYFAP